MSQIRRKSRFSPANTVDILRMEQRDKDFVDFLQSELSQFLKSWLGNDYNKIAKYMRPLAETAYYLSTSVRNLQTIGEEYAGILRICGSDRRATLLIQICWLLFAIYGDKIYTKLLVFLVKYVESSDELLPEVKAALLKFFNFLKVYKDKLLMIHQALFFMGNAFYNLSNRLIGVRYILVNQFLGDNSSTNSFKWLGKVSLVYLFVYLCKEYVNFSKPSEISEEQFEMSTKLCVLCSETCKNVSSTPCGHLFCWECIFDSLKYNQKCPICREDVNPSRIVCLRNYS